MGYNVYITRREDWFDHDEDTMIDQDEWADVVDADDEMDWDEENEPLYAVWEGSPDIRFWYSEGNIETKNPNVKEIRKMFELATRLGAAVQGEGLEMYDENGEQWLTEARQAEIQELSQRTSLWGRLMKRLTGRD